MCLYICASIYLSMCCFVVSLSDPVYPTLPSLTSAPSTAMSHLSSQRVFCYNLTAEMTCDRSLISIDSAHYGHTRVPCRNTANDTDVFQADCVMNVWPLVHGRCSDKVRCSFQVSEDVFGRPCSGSRGTGLGVVYHCVPGRAACPCSPPSRSLCQSKAIGLYFLLISVKSCVMHCYINVSVCFVTLTPHYFPILHCCVDYIREPITHLFLVICLK